ncbi:cytochrome-c peroxidase [Pantoea wallisii]|uniref:Cytochrome-c peroxidase n=1 Tax=Pantoea wallisii TaxID=1076551 RepID=A0A1X1D2L0_9GAMM|nr:LacI family DNA-binding transcriptional regulator [Pantoea wallisii]ORM70918.1 cytochrome-c peroxidase [Pantoea wallisii]
MSIEKVARLAGVSKATVSRVLNQHPGVRPDTRTRVLTAINVCEYQPNLLARQLRTSQSNMLLVLISDITNPFCSRVVEGIEAEAEAQGYHILLCNTRSQLRREAAYIALLTGKVADGVITMDAADCLQELQGLIGDAPWVQCAEYDPAIPASSVSIDNREAAFETVRFLAGKGRRRIALVNCDMRYLYSHQRESGYRAALEELGLSWSGVAYAEGISCEAGSAALRELLAQPEPPDAVFTVSDVLAVGVIHAALEAGLRIPEDLAVVGFDGISFTSSLNPPLTTIEQPMNRLGARSVQLLLERIRQPQAAIVHEVLPWRRVERASS